MENESGVNLINFRQCTLYHPSLNNLTMPEGYEELFGKQHKMGAETCDMKPGKLGFLAGGIKNENMSCWCRHVHEESQQRVHGGSPATMRR
uniref:Uncharacterized protein n=1 Tax=Oryza nivara TaxID=4536 RepID=A0A0E0IQA2_ORYNI